MTKDTVFGSMHRAAVQLRSKQKADTGAGVLYPYHFTSTNESNAEVKIKQALGELEFFRASARAFLTRTVGAFLFATGAMCVGAFFATTELQHKYLCLLGAIINFVATYHYHAISKIREGLDIWQLGQWSRPVEEEKQEATHQSSIEEFYVDALRFSDWAVTMFLLTIKLYVTIGRAYNDDYNGLHLTPIGAGFLSMLMIVLGGFTRLGADDLWDIGLVCGRGGSARRLCLVNVAGLASLLGSLTCLIILQMDLWAASAYLGERRLLTSFFAVWIGYPIVFICSILWRICVTARVKSGVGKSRFEPGVSVIKDVSYGLLDAWAKGVFALWTANNVFGLSVFSTSSMTF